MSDTLNTEDDPGIDGTSDAPEEIKRGSIRTNLLRRILPVVLLPLLGLGILAILGAVLIQSRTSDAVNSAEDILNTEVVAAGAERSADTSARAVAEFIDELVLRTVRTTSDAAFRETVVQASNGNDEDEVRAEVVARTARDQITISEENLQVLIVAEDGRSLGSTHEETLDDYATAPWFTQALDEGASFRSFVLDGEHPASLELAVRVVGPATVDGTAVVRVRAPLSNIHGLVDQLALEGGVTAGIADISSSVIIADTATMHDPGIVFLTDQFENPESGINVEQMSDELMVEGGPGAVIDEEIITATRSVAAEQNNELGVTADWIVQTNQSAEVAGESLSEIRDVAETVERQRATIFVAVGFLLVLALFLAYMAIRAIASNITAPVAQLSEQARIAAEEGIPAIVEAARTSEQLPDLPDFEVETNDELALLADSLNTMQGAAVDLAGGQAKLRRQNVARTFVSLGRRNQNLLNRQLEFIDELERQESDPDTLENLFRLDHLATRMRRNAENLLVLAGEQTPRRWGKPIAVRDVIRAAAAEIADYRRVKLGDIDVATVSGNLATDLSHLIAELLENAGSFSPPTTSIEVLGQKSATHYRLAIVDHGIGMDDRAMEEANDRLRNPVDFADAPSAYLGLFVVGRLAQDIGITVRLTSADPTGEGKRRGTIAFVDLPIALLSTAEANPIEVNEPGVVQPDANARPAAERLAEPVEAPSLAPAAAAPVSPEPEPALASAPADPAETTAAGFPQRRRQGGTEAAEAPASSQAPPTAVTVPDPAEAPEPVEAKTVPVAPVTETTAAGFPKRRATAAKTPEPEAPSTPDEDAPVPRRDATAVSDSLRSFRAAVARGRQTGAAAATPAQAPTATPPATTPTPAAAPAPTTPVAPAAPVAAAPQAAPTATPPVPEPAAVAEPVAAPAPPVAPVAPVAAAPMPQESAAPAPITHVEAPVTPSAVPTEPVAPTAPSMAPPVVDTVPANATPTPIPANPVPTNPAPTNPAPATQTAPVQPDTASAPPVPAPPAAESAVVEPSQETSTQPQRTTGSES